MIKHPPQIDEQLLWLFTEMHGTQKFALSFVEWFMNNFRHTSPRLVMYAGLMPLFREEGSLVTELIQQDTLETLKTKFLMDKNGWNSAIPAIKDSLRKRRVFPQSPKCVAHEKILTEFFREKDPPTEKDRRHATILFFLLWEAECRTLEEKGIAPTP
ncbi:MAG: hypothetical protein WCJ29_00015 [bacterium]